MTRKLLREFRRFRGHTGLVGRDAECALSAARTELLWDKLESAGLVQLTAEPDEYFDFDDFDYTESEIERLQDDGAWGTVGRFRLSEDDRWEVADSVWGHVGYRDVLSPVENPYIVDIKSSTIEDLRAALKSRCPLCRTPHAA